MRKALLLCTIALASCAGKSDTFTVADPDGLAKSAVLQLDGHAQSLTRNNKRLSTVRQIMRDAHGRILITYADGRKVDCPIGYM
jgi:hypothetical protein